MHSRGGGPIRRGRGGTTSRPNTSPTSIRRAVPSKPKMPISVDLSSDSSSNSDDIPMINAIKTTKAAKPVLLSSDDSFNSEGDSNEYTYSDSSSSPKAEANWGSPRKPANDGKGAGKSNEPQTNPQRARTSRPTTFRQQQQQKQQQFNRRRQQTVPQHSSNLNYQNDAGEEEEALDEKNEKAHNPNSFNDRNNKNSPRDDEPNHQQQQRMHKRPRKQPTQQSDEVTSPAYQEQSVQNPVQTITPKLDEPSPPTESQNNEQTPPNLTTTANADTKHENNNINTDNNSNNSNNIIPISNVSPENRIIRLFNVYREIKGFSLLRKEELRMLENEKAIYFSAEAKDNIGKFHVISSSLPTVYGAPNFSGILRANSKANKFLVVSKEEKPSDDREGELCGIFLSPVVGSKTKCKMVKIAIPNDNKPHFAISKRVSLATIAAEESVYNPKFATYTSKLPQMGSSGKLVVDFGEVFVVPSMKNVLINNENGDLIFALYKTAQGSFGVRCSYPVTPLIAFGISIALITTMK